MFWNSVMDDTGFDDRGYVRIVSRWHHRMEVEMINFLFCFIWFEKGRVKRIK